MVLHPRRAELLVDVSIAEGFSAFLGMQSGDKHAPLREEAKLVVLNNLVTRFPFLRHYLRSFRLTSCAKMGSLAGEDL